MEGEFSQQVPSNLASLPEETRCKLKQIVASKLLFYAQVNAALTIDASFRSLGAAPPSSNVLEEMRRFERMVEQYLEQDELQAAAEYLKALEEEDVTDVETLKTLDEDDVKDLGFSMGLHMKILNFLGQ